jgi:enterochelin esterase-like enzyme/plasmid stability protein
MLEPQSTALFVLLIVIFGALMWRVLVARRVAFRVLAACLAFVPAMLFGVLGVNKYYGYYQTWGAMLADLTNQGVSASSQVPDVKLTSGGQSGTLDGSHTYLRLAQQQGDLLRLMVTGQRSRISRVVYVWLPPQYFQPAYQAYRFPVIELIHGQPGQPQDWITVVGVTRTFDHLLEDKLAQPAVLVMPDANGGEGISLQCLNQAGGPQDLTYLAVDLPTQIAGILRVVPPGSAWGVAGYSEGGFCAANMALRYPQRYGFAGVLSGYFAPSDNQLAGRLVSPFGGNTRWQEQNTPLLEIQKLPAGAVIPQFWLAAGAADRQDVADAEGFWQELRLRQPDTPLTLTPGGGHSMATWRAEVPSMLIWMTPGLARMSAGTCSGLPYQRDCIMLSMLVIGCVAIIHVRDVSEGTLTTLKVRAARSGQSLQGYVRQLLEREAAVLTPEEAAERARTIAARSAVTADDVTEAIAAMREARG